MVKRSYDTYTITVIAKIINNFNINIHVKYTQKKDVFHVLDSQCVIFIV